mmetsp:Transcript_129083/g.413662  ORF Transcript_129083/g.413662 Transcript_129083/m.413662 type:complete len:533 (-) Transcript_129083:702-2300(-)
MQTLPSASVAHHPSIVLCSTGPSPTPLGAKAARTAPLARFSSPPVRWPMTAATTVELPRAPCVTLSKAPEKVVHPAPLSPEAGAEEEDEDDDEGERRQRTDCILAPSTCKVPSQSPSGNRAGNRCRRCRSACSLRTSAAPAEVSASASAGCPNTKGRQVTCALLLFCVTLSCEPGGGVKCMTSQNSGARCSLTSLRGASSPALTPRRSMGGHAALRPRLVTTSTLKAAPPTTWPSTLICSTYSPSASTSDRCGLCRSALETFSDPRASASWSSLVGRGSRYSIASVAVKTCTHAAASGSAYPNKCTSNAASSLSGTCHDDATLPGSFVWPSNSISWRPQRVCEISPGIATTPPSKAGRPEELKLSTAVPKSSAPSTSICSEACETMSHAPETLAMRNFAGSTQPASASNKASPQASWALFASSRSPLVIIDSVDFENLTPPSGVRVSSTHWVGEKAHTQGPQHRVGCIPCGGPFSPNTAANASLTRRPATSSRPSTATASAPPAPSAPLPAAPPPSPVAASASEGTGSQRGS